MKILSSITFQGKYHFFAQFSLEEVAQSFAWLMEIINIPMIVPRRHGSALQVGVQWSRQGLK